MELVRRLRGDIPMAVCCLDEEGTWARDLQAEGTVVTALGRGVGFTPGLGRRVAAAAASHGATVLHCHHYSPFVYAALARLWRPLGHRVIYTEHGRLSDAPPSRKRWLANGVLRAAPRGVFTVSRELRDHLVDEGFAARAVDVIYNGIAVGPLPDTGARQRVRDELGVADDTLVLSTIARLDAVKDLGVLLRAAGRLLPQLPLRIVIVGDGPERRNLEDVAAECGITAHVRFLGHREDARRWLAGSDIFVNTSISEGISLTILEAMAAGLPVIATAVGGTPEIVNDDCGRLVPAREPAALAAAILELANAGSRRHELGQAARRRAETLFTIERMVAEYRAVYEGVSS
jgi:glycosyltransferase involved in cell wall biosynthesis